MAYTLTINGKKEQVDVPADMPLLWVLRDILGMKGTKFGCGIGACGACTVHLGANAQRACQTKVGDVKADIATIESLAPASGGLHPLQQAWMDLDVPQCGYCQAGQ